MLTVVKFALRKNSNMKVIHCPCQEKSNEFKKSAILARKHSSNKILCYIIIIKTVGSRNCVFIISSHKVEEQLCLTRFPTPSPKEIDYKCCSAPLLAHVLPPCTA
jgi:hypothetical protein